MRFAASSSAALYGRGDTVDYTIPELADPPAACDEAQKHAILKDLEE
ncbi:hypothetical protein [Paraburkholderia strydomiana]|nr:hypothetical protein [Paraburkholderia strydomiana]MDR7006188.1 hypothetical protein [Paraburkholderia strydomiana]